ncbi:MAG: glutathione S-transferase family protein [Pseudomonadota bacterium]
MGFLLEGTWRKDDQVPTSKEGAFERSQAEFRNWVTPDGAPGPSGKGGYKAEAGRYHLYVAYACPWAHRALLLRTLKDLDALIGVSVVHWYMGDEGWSLEPDGEAEVGDRIGNAQRLRDVYLRSDPQASGRVTVPVLWDRETQTIVSNESSEIVRMFNSAFDNVGANDADFYPAPLRDEIDALNARIYDTVNNGVYKAGFTRDQGQHESAVRALFETLDALEVRLGEQRFLTGDAVTEADWRLFPTLLRFDPVYVTHFKCNLRRLADYPNLLGYTRDLYQWPGVRETINLEHTRLHYYRSHGSVNPSALVPLGFEVDLEAPPQRGPL